MSRTVRRVGAVNTIQGFIDYRLVYDLSTFEYYSSGRGRLRVFESYEEYVKHFVDRFHRDINDTQWRFSRFVKGTRGIEREVRHAGIKRMRMRHKDAIRNAMKSGEFEDVMLAKRDFTEVYEYFLYY